ncbi:MAG: GNAT family N-acetyltransferase [Eubacterium sp.]|nr:GNAT family N-acetyltransferase [Eubacterium sp.]
MLIRRLRDDERDLLEDFTYEAIYLPEGIQPPERSIVAQPELAVYYENFGSSPADYCLVAETDGKVVGAVWTRIMDDYGHVDDDIPSFAIALYKDYRGKGMGTELMKRMLELLKIQGYKKASLAVQKANYAVRMYETVGFQIIDENAEEYIMVCSL